MNHSILIFVVISFLIVGLIRGPSFKSEFFSVYAAEPDPRVPSMLAQGGYCDIDAEMGNYKCCWTETVEGSPIEMNECQTCLYDSSNGETTYCDPVVPDCDWHGCDPSFPVPESPPLKDDITDPLAGGGIEDQGSNATTPTDQNVAPGGGGGIVEQGTEVPSNKGTRNPLDTILGFNGPPIPAATTGGNEEPELGASEGETSERIINQSPTGYCVRDIVTTCIPCDVGLPGGEDRCIPNSEWPSENDTGIPKGTDIPGHPASGDTTGRNVGNEVATPTTDEEVPATTPETGTEERSEEKTTNGNGSNQPQLPTEPAFLDSDDDSIPDEQDNCPMIANEEQQDSDGDGVGDVCDQLQQQQQEQQPGGDSSENQGDEEQGQPSEENQGDTDSEEDIANPD